MKLELTGRQTPVTPKLKKQAEAELAAVTKIVGKSSSCHVILTEDRYRRIAEVTVRGKDCEFVATCEGAETAVALHAAIAKVGQQAIRHNQRQTTSRRHPRIDVKSASAQIADGGLLKAL